jgi:hypothetical protein
MVMDGYPRNPQHFDQLEIWNVIQTHRSDDATDESQGWYTHPIGMKGCLMEMHHPPGGSWVIHQDPDSDRLLYDIFYWMNRNSYPVPVIVYIDTHWVVIIGYETNVEPDGSNEIDFERIKIHNPWEYIQDNWISRWEWNLIYWGLPVLMDGSWKNDYVAVIEPPDNKGKITKRKEQIMGEKCISPESALVTAQRWLENHKIKKFGSYDEFKAKIRTPVPFLVTALEKGDKICEDYIVPFCFEENLVSFSIIINAFNEEFGEIGSFEPPIRYLTKEEAIKVVLKTFKSKSKFKPEISARLIFQASRLSLSPLFPFWEISMGEKIFYVTQKGQIFSQIYPLPPG